MPYKIKTFKGFLEYLRTLHTENTIILGDFNIAHTSMDLANPEQNLNNTMFTKEERALLTELLDLGFVDCFRSCHPSKREYTWWLRAFECRKRNIGWRIDYILVSRNLEKYANCWIPKDKLLEQVSDHAPVVMDLARI